MRLDMAVLDGRSDSQLGLVHTGNTSIGFSFYLRGLVRPLVFAKANNWALRADNGHSPFAQDASVGGCGSSTGGFLRLFCWPYLGGYLAAILSSCAWRT